MSSCESNASTIHSERTVDFGGPSIDLIGVAITSRAGNPPLIVEQQGANSAHRFLGSVVKGCSLPIIWDVGGMWSGINQSSTGSDIHLLATWDCDIHEHSAVRVEYKDGRVAIYNILIVEGILDLEGTYTWSNQGP